MSPAAAAIPDPPRPARWRCCLAQRWMFGVPGLAVLILGGALLALSFLSGRGGPWLADTRLDSGAISVDGTLISIEPEAGGATHLAYRFQPSGGGDHRDGIAGASFSADTAGFRPGQTVTVEFWPADPRISRISGTAALYLDPTMANLANLLLILGILATAWWLRSALQLRLTLRDGRLVQAQIIDLEPVHFLSPSQMRVRYQFHDTAGVEHIHSHWLRLDGELARRLQEAKPRHLAVIHDRTDPRRSRAIDPSDFQPDNSSRDRQR